MAVHLGIDPVGQEIGVELTSDHGKKHVKKGQNNNKPSPK